MRSLFSLLMVLLTTLSFANTKADTHGTSCRETYILSGNSNSLAVAVEKDLLSGVWSVDGAFRYTFNSKDALFEFNESGTLDVFVTDLNGKTRYESKLWYVEQFGHTAFLVVENTPNSRDFLFEVEQTCEGVILNDVTGGETVFLTYMKGASSSEYQLTRTLLNGEWTNIEYPFEITSSLEDCGTFEKMEGAHMEYIFNQDGTFQRIIGSAVMQIEEQGIWSLSANGSFVTLYFSKDGSPEHIYGQSVLRIDNLDGQTLQIEQYIETDDFQSFFCTPVKKFAFEKMRS